MWPTLSLLRTQQHELACNRRAFFCFEPAFWGPQHGTMGKQPVKTVVVTHPSSNLGRELGTLGLEGFLLIQCSLMGKASRAHSSLERNCALFDMHRDQTLQEPHPKTTSRCLARLQNNLASFDDRLGWWPRHEDVWQLLLAVPEYPAAHCHLKASQMVPGEAASLTVPEKMWQRPL